MRAAARGDATAAADAAPPRHGLVDDAQALLTGTLFVALALMLFRQAGLMTGGTAGIALLAHYASGWRFGLLFFCVNLPFYWLAWQRMGRRFTLKTMAAVTLLALLSEALPQWLAIERLNPLFAAMAGGLWLVNTMDALLSHPERARPRGRVPKLSLLPAPSAVRKNPKLLFLTISAVTW
jgi:hypothetical protein